ncbi:MAG: hypothetical protein ACLQUY_14700 [Ktedonobacterales bacterium]
MAEGQGESDGDIALFPALLFNVPRHIAAVLHTTPLGSGFAYGANASRV